MRLGGSFRLAYERRERREREGVGVRGVGCVIGVTEKFGIRSSSSLCHSDSDSLILILILILRWLT